MWVMDQIAAIRRGGDEAHEAALALGLLIEREKVHRPTGDDGGISVILDDELAARRLSPSELQTAVDELLAYIHQAEQPHPMAVWALSKSYDERIVPDLINLLKRTMTAPAAEHLSYQALVGMINIGMGSPHEAAALETIRQASVQGHGQVQETAAQYLAEMGGTA